MSHDFLGLTTREMLNLRTDQPVTLSARLNEDLINCFDQLRNLPSKRRFKETSLLFDGPPRLGESFVNSSVESSDVGSRGVRGDI